MMRTAKTIGIVLGLYVVAILAELIIAAGVSESGGGIGAITFLGSLGYLATKVGYRWFDCFFAMIPFYGIFFIFRIAYRIAYLPNRDWAERI